MRTLTPTRHRLSQSNTQKGASGTRTLATTFTASGAATTPEAPTSTVSCAQRKRRDSNPHRPTGRPRLANACDETDIRLSSNHMPPPGIEPGLRASHARVVIRSTTGTDSRFIPHSSLIPPHIPARTRTRNAAFDAPHDHPFQHGDAYLVTSEFWLLTSPLFKRVPVPKEASRIRTTLARTKIASQNSFVACAGLNRRKSNQQKTPKTFRASGLAVRHRTSFKLVTRNTRSCRCEANSGAQP